MQFYVIVLIFSSSIITQAAESNENHYEKYSTFKNGKVFSYDPYVWAYTKEFSKKFNMPNEWIDNNLKGMVAVAFRMTTVGTLYCGYGKNENSCWPPLKCQMDIYYNNKIKLPWTREEIRSALLQRGLYSTDYLRYSSTRGIREYKRHNGGFGVLESGGVIQMKKDRGGAASIKYFDRDFAKDIGLISFTGLGVCPRVVSEGYMNIYDKDTAYKLSRGVIQKENATPMHVFEFPESFLGRANVVYKIKDLNNVKFTRQLLKEFKDSQK